MNLLEERYIDVGGYRLHTVTEGRGPALLLLHGFTGSTDTLAATAAALRRDFCTIRVDLPGHGRSDAPQELEPYTMESCVEALCRVLDALEIERTCVFGYSMGGRTALALSAAYADRVCAVAALGASAGIDDEGERAERVAQDEALASFILEDGLEAFVDRWMRHPLFETQQTLGEEFLATARAQRLTNEPQALALSLRGMGAGAQAPVGDTLSELDLPILLLAGMKDTQYCAAAIELGERLREAQIELIPGAGHAAHLENPEETHARIRSFFRQVTGLTGANLI